MRRRSFLAQAGAMVGTGALARVIQFPLVSTASAAIRLNAQSAAASGSELEPLLSLFDFETEAHTRIPHGAWERISGGSADEITLRWNREAYEHIRLKPRILVDVSKLDTRVKLFGQELPFPILLAPTGGQRFIHPEGEVAAARGAAAANSIYVISSSASMKVEDIASSTKGPVWFQLYVQKDRAFTRDLVQRAEDSGCRALCVTVDSPTFGARNREDRAKKELPERELPNLKGKDYLDPTLTWKDIDWLRSFARSPVLLKGVLNPDDAATAVKLEPQASSFRTMVHAISIPFPPPSMRFRWWSRRSQAGCRCWWTEAFVAARTSSRRLRSARRRCRLAVPTCGVWGFPERKASPAWSRFFGRNLKSRWR
jgi:phosphoribosylanthranilate isomerase